MSRTKELIKNTFIIGIGKFGTKILTFLLLPFYTSCLSTSEYGVYDLLITISILVLPFITMLMEEGMFRFLIDSKSQKEEREILSNTSFFVLLNSILFIIIFIIVSLFITIPYKWLFLSYILLAIIEAVRNAIVRGLSKIKMYSISNFVSSIVLIVLNIIFIAKLGMGVKGLLLSYIISSSMVSIFIFIKLKIYKLISYKDVNYNKMKEMFKYSLPLVPNSISWTIINLSDRLVISYYIGSNANGIYSISNKFPSVMDSFYSFFYTAWKESAAKNLKYEDSAIFYNKIYDNLKKMLVSVVLFMLIFLPLCFNLLIKNEFRNAYLYIPVLVVSMYFSNMSGFYGGIFSAYKDTKIMGITTIVSALLNLLINIIFIKTIGIWAAAISTIISTFIVFFFRKRKLKRYVKLNENMSAGLLTLFFLGLALLFYYYNNFIIRIICFVFVLLYGIVINKELIQIIFKKLKLKSWFIIFVQL